MSKYKELFDILQQTQVLRHPRQSLATFGVSEIRYNFVSPLSSQPAQAKLRTGVVTAQRPKILTREILEQRFSGFGEGAEKFAEMLGRIRPDMLRALEYTFQNRLDQSVTHSLDVRELVDNIQREMDDAAEPRVAVIAGPEAGWQLSLMKFIVDETLRAFPSHVRELDEHGMFDPAQAAMVAKRRGIEELFRRAAQNPSDLSALGKRLKDEGLFEEYQDRFFSLVQRN